MKWNDFKTSMMDFAIEDDQHWCSLCGNTDGACASNSTSSDNGSSSSSSSGGGGGGVSKPVAGVIGALVTLVVILGIEAIIMLLGGLRLVKKSARGQNGSTAGGVKA